ncbi:MAG: T9SS type A sorting domain-containing protein [Lentimicrobiaceae bacterium]|nr:T9SS type A sorting domain-containing protein [Lentimicrobiaceae bacterium]
MTDEIKVFDVVGQVVGTYCIRPENTKIEIDISHLASGLYFLKIDGKTVKMVKQ